MTHTNEMQSTRPAEDIMDDIAAIIRRYPPLAQSRHAFAAHVGDDGSVTLTGNIKSTIAGSILQANITGIPGVTALDMRDLVSDEQLRLRAGKLLPAGVRAHVDYGRVVLTGSLPPRFKAATLAGKLEALPGVRRVINQLD